MTNVPKRYVPSNLSYKDKRRQRRELKKSRNFIKKENIIRVKRLNLLKVKHLLTF